MFLYFGKDSLPVAQANWTMLRKTWVSQLSSEFYAYHCILLNQQSHELTLTLHISSVHLVYKAFDMNGAIDRLDVKL